MVFIIRDLMKKLAIVLALILAGLLAVCFFLPRQGVPQATEPTKNSTAPVHPSETEPTQPSESEPTKPYETQPTQPSETQPVQEPEDDDFVLISDWVPDVRVELAYATTDNFTGTKIYEFHEAYLRYGTVKKLAAAAELLKRYGYGILVWDGYRPVYAQQKLWDVCPDPTYVSPPGTGTQSHCRGIAVDVTLYDLESGELLEMPSGFDEFSALGDRDYSDCSVAVRENVLILETIMKNCGFKPYSGEWWHFSDTVSYEIEYEFDPAGQR